MEKTRIVACALALFLAAGTVEASAAPQYKRGHIAKALSKTGATTLTISQNSASFGSEGGLVVIDVNCNSTWTVKNAIPWVSVESHTSAGIIRVHAEENYGSSPRTGTFYIHAGSLTQRIDVYQEEYLPATLEVSDTEVRYDNYTGSKTLNVKSNKNWTVDESSYDWFNVTKDGGMVQIDVQRNESIRPREGSFTVRAGDKTTVVTVKQSGYEPYFSLSSQNLDFDAAGGTSTIAVESESNEWSYDEHLPAWVIVSRVGNKINVYAEPNPYQEARSATFSVGFGGGYDKQIVVQQFGTLKASNAVVKKQESNNDYGKHDDVYYGGKPSSGGSRFRVGIELVGQMNTNYLFKKSGDDPALIYGYGGGLIFGIGRYTDVLNFTFGGKFMQFRYDLKTGYHDDKGTVGNYIVIPANLKINTFRMGSSKFYLGGGYEYGIPLKDAVKFQDWNAGIGVNSRHVDWYIFYKGFIGDDSDVSFTGDYKGHIGTSLTFYF